MRRAITVLLVLSVVLLSTLATAQQPKPNTPEDKQVVDSKATRRSTAASVNFRQELGLPFSSLSTLGPRIDEARRKYDPVTLAHTASELSVAEKVSGKKASVTSSQLLQESASLAKLRSQVSELQAVQRVSDQIADEQDLVRSLQTEIQLANERSRLDTEAIQKNLEPTWQPRKVTVNNYTPQYVTIWVNGNLKAELPPGQSQVCIIEHRWNPVVLTAHGNNDVDTWGPRYLWGRFEKYTWNIN
jgi:hypothetical protein